MKDYNEMAESVLNRRDKYVLERRKQMKRLTATISCLCLCALVGVGAWQGGMFSKMQNEMGDASVVPSSAVITENSSGTAQEKEMFTMDNFASEDPSDATGEQIITPDAPVQNETGDGDALTHYDAVWGGSYLNDSGNWVVWLTEDTPEVRDEVFKHNPTISESGTEFRKAGYSLAYLTQLMADISKAMVEKQLPFVSSASLREDLNRIEISMTDENVEFITKVQSFDTLGGAIEFRYGTLISEATDDILREPTE